MSALACCESLQTASARRTSLLVTSLNTNFLLDKFFTFLKSRPFFGRLLSQYPYCSLFLPQQQIQHETMPCRWLKHAYMVQALDCCWKVRPRTSAWYSLHVDATRQNVILPYLPGVVLVAIRCTLCKKFYCLVSSTGLCARGMTLGIRNSCEDYDWREASELNRIFFPHEEKPWPSHHLDCIHIGSTRFNMTEKFNPIRNPYTTACSRWRDACEGMRNMTPCITLSMYDCTTHLEKHIFTILSFAVTFPIATIPSFLFMHYYFS